MGHRFSRVPGTYAICRMPSEAGVPAWAGGGFTSVTHTADELSVVCEERRVPAVAGEPALQVERGWVVLKLHGPFPFDAVGVLAAVARPLADAGVSLFALSTFDTDYVLVKEIQAKQAIVALTLAGHTFVQS